MSSRVASGSEHLSGLALIAPPLAAPGWQPPPTLDVDGPVLLIAGRQDRSTAPPDALAAFGQTLPRATVTILEATDHFVFTALQPLTTAPCPPGPEG